MKIINKHKKEKFIPVDDWIGDPGDYIINHCKGFMIMPISKIFNTDISALDRFDLNIKRSYNNEDLRKHCVQYINYFEKFYDKDKELLLVYANLKYLIDLEEGYNIDAFIYDLKKYILNNISLMYKIKSMNIDNYDLNLDYNNKKNPNLQYNNKHGLALMQMSLIINILIPLLTHFAYTKKIQISIDNFLLQVYNEVLNIFDIDIYSKLYETCMSNINRNKSNNSLWQNQDIRSINATTHAIYSVNSIIVNIIPKYDYCRNFVLLNYASIKNNIRFQVIDISYEYDYMPLSSSKRDEDQNSEFDKFESGLTKLDESLYLQNNINSEQTMKYLSSKFNIFQDEIDFYMKELFNDSPVINQFQKDLVFNLFYKYFGDVVSIKGINKEDYVKLIIISKRILQSNNMVILPYILSGKVVRLVSRKNLNKRELLKLQASPYYNTIINKYKSEKIVKYILSTIGTILSSEIKIIDYYDRDLNGKPINTDMTEIICEEICIYINLI